MEISGVENVTSLTILMAWLLVNFNQDQELCEVKHSQSSCIIVVVQMMCYYSLLMKYVYSIVYIVGSKYNMEARHC